jgi:cytoskeletal protein RodZ
LDELGSILREAREAQGLTLAQVGEQTRINPRFLSALESGDYGLLPTPVHVRGYLRNYARFLELDPEPLLERYEVTSKAQPVAKPDKVWDTVAVGATPDETDPTFFNPINFDIESKSRDSESLMRLAIIAALIVVIALTVNRFFFSDRNSDNDLAAAVSAIVGEDGDPGDGGNGGAAASTPVPGTDVISTSRNDQAQAGPTPTRPQLPPTLEEINLRLEITERTWFQITIDSEVVFEGLGRQGEIYEWTAEQEARLRTGNAIGLFVTINDTQLGKLGGRNEIVDETWSTASN